MSSSIIKAVALAAMLTDHIGAVCFPQYILFRVIGRLALPLFAWQLALSVDKTRSRKKLLVRIGSFALISQVPYAALFGNRLNIFFSLALSVLVLSLYRKERAAGCLALFLCVTLAEALGVEYGWYGVMMAFLFYVYRDNRRSMMLSQLILNLLYFMQHQSMQPLALASLLIILLHNSEKGRLYRHKFALYAVYPVHMLLLSLLK